MSELSKILGFSSKKRSNRRSNRKKYIRLIYIG